MRRVPSQISPPPGRRRRKRHALRGQRPPLPVRATDARPFPIPDRQHPPLLRHAGPRDVPAAGDGRARAVAVRALDVDARAAWIGVHLGLLTVAVGQTHVRSLERDAHPAERLVASHQRDLPVALRHRVPLARLAPAAADPNRDAPHPPAGPPWRRGSPDPPAAAARARPPTGPASDAARSGHRGTSASPRDRRPPRGRRAAPARSSLRPRPCRRPPPGRAARSGAGRRGSRRRARRRPRPRPAARGWPGRGGAFLRTTGRGR